MTAVVVPLPNIWGASAEDWTHFDMILGLLDDLLPVVSNPHAEIAEGSTLKALGKVPSVYDRAGKVVGLRNWTSRCTTANEMTGWAAQRDYGICVQTRRCRAIDIDIDDPVKAARIASYVDKALGVALPRRVRDGTAKLLMPVLVAGEMGKTVIHTDGGAVEVLGNGQQFIAVGTHPKGAKYRWEGGLPGSIPEVSPDAFRELLAGLAEAYAIAPVVEGKAPGEREADIAGVDDPVADWLESQGLVEGSTPRGLKVRCPWADEHSNGSEEAMWLPAGGRSKAEGHFKCLHSHCEGRTRSDYLAAVGYVEDIASQFDDLSSEADAPIEDLVAAETAKQRPKISLVSIEEFTSRPRPTWLIKGVLPKADLGVVYGAPGSGKTFAVLDMCLAVARGAEWRGRKVKAGPVVYICQEGQGGFQLRLEALQVYHGQKFSELPLRIIGDSLSIHKPEQIKPLAEAIKGVFAETALIVIDTLAAAAAGFDENTSKDMTIVIDNCKRLHRETGAMVLLIHHSGKDESKGARGSNALLGADHVEMCVKQGSEDGVRILENTKMKDGALFPDMAFRLKSVWLGDDEDGDPIDSCVLVEEDVPERVVPKEKKERLGDREKVALEVFAELSIGGAEVTLSELVITAAERYGGEGMDYARRGNMKTTVKNLITKGYLGWKDPHVFSGVRG